MLGYTGYMHAPPHRITTYLNTFMFLRPALLTDLWPVWPLKEGSVWTAVVICCPWSVSLRLSRTSHLLCLVGISDLLPLPAWFHTANFPVSNVGCLIPWLPRYSMFRSKVFKLGCWRGKKCTNSNTQMWKGKILHAERGKKKAWSDRDSPRR